MSNKLKIKDMKTAQDFHENYNQFDANIEKEIITNLKPISQGIAEKNNMDATVEVFNVISRKYMTVKISKHHYITEEGEKVYRVETKGRTGRIQHANGYYLDPVGKGTQIYGMGFSPRHDWGRSIVGFIKHSEIENSQVRFK